ncbi:MAG TPA: hypothetical protein VKQ06_01395 [Gammaproteobacteria bacterium]|nr:hypothetical protein [Gammaproteobacteria bacterium]
MRRHRFVLSVLVALAAAATFVSIRAQEVTPQPGGIGISDTDTSRFDPRDLSGLWSRLPSQYGLPPCPECRDPVGWPGYGFFGATPPRTPEGERRFQANRPARGLELGSAEADARTDLDIGYRRAVLPAFGNDPEMRCEPLGLARLITFSGIGAAMEMVQTDDRIIQLFEWTWEFRDIWMDGRGIPDVEDYLPRFNGYSVGRWERDTLVVTSVGFDDRQWLDQYGFPISEQAVLEERWERPSPNRLRVQLTLTDPVNYTQPWEGSPKVWALIPKDEMAIGGWSGILEDRCVPSDESLFNEFRDQAAGIGEVGDDDSD